MTGVVAMLAIVALLFVLPLALWVWVVSVNAPTHYADVFDEFAVPDSWALAHIEIKAPGVDACVPAIGDGDCPAVTRDYLVDADPSDAFNVTRQMVTHAGFQVEQRQVAACSTNGPGGPMSCYLSAVRGSDHPRVIVSDRGELVSYYRGLKRFTVGAPGRSLVAIVVAGR
jgi:hypothetical protein